MPAELAPQARTLARREGGPLRAVLAGSWRQRSGHRRRRGCREVLALV